MDGKQAQSLDAELNAAKARLRSISSGRPHRGVSGATPEEAKVRFLEVSSQLEATGREVLFGCGVGRLESWTRRQPWQAAFAALAAGLLAGRLKRSDVFLVNCLMQLLAEASCRGK